MDKYTENQQKSDKPGSSLTKNTIGQMERWFEDYYPRHWLHRWGLPTWGELTRPLERVGPRVDVIDREEEIILRAELPGVTKEALEVTVTDSSVTIKGRTKYQHKEEEGDYYRSEIASGEFSRSLGLPCPVDSDQTKATFTDGVLELVMPKSSKSRRVQISLD